jgi:methyl-accepting chemotaxis protein
MSTSTLRRLHALLMRTGTKWMRQRPLKTKFQVVGLACSVPMVLLLVLSTIYGASLLHRDLTERAGVAMVRPLLRLVADMQNLRFALVLPTETVDRTAQIDVAKARVVSSLADVDRVAADSGLLAGRDVWAVAREQVLALAALDAKVLRRTAIATAARAIGKTRRTLGDVVHLSRLDIDPGDETHGLIDLAIHRLPTLMEATALAAVEAAITADRGDLHVSERWHLAARTEAAALALAAVQASLDHLVLTGMAQPGTWQVLSTEGRRMAALMEASFAGLALPPSGAELRAAGRAALDPVHRLADDMLAELDVQLRARIAAQCWALAAIAAACLLSLAAALYLTQVFVRSFAGSMKAMKAALEHLADGDLSVRVDVTGDDELAAMGRALERTAGRLSALVAEIRTSAVRVDQAGTDVARDGQSIAESAEAQSCGVDEAVGASRHLSAAMIEGKDMLSRVDLRTRELGDMGSQCQTVMGQSLVAIGQLDDSVHRVAEVNAMIDDIAFQTHLLSINASVEAARAGDAGKGFGVVAASVRALSARCAEAAAQVRELIDETANQSGQSRDRVVEASRLVDGLANGVEWVHAELERVAAVTEQQSRSLAEVSRGVGKLENVGQGQARALAAALTASQALTEQAEVLRSSVSTIRLRQGSADEAQAMVERALKHISEVGWERAVQAFHRPDGEFVDRDMFLFAVDADDRYVVAGFNPAAAGRKLHDMRIMTAAMTEHYLDSARAAAATGGGWIDYQLLSSVDGTTLDKSAYVADLGDGAFIACGVLRQTAGEPPIEHPRYGPEALDSQEPPVAADAELPSDRASTTPATGRGGGATGRERVVAEGAVHAAGPLDDTADSEAAVM